MNKVIAITATVLCILFIGSVTLALGDPNPLAAGSTDFGSPAPIGGIIAAAAVGGGYALKKLNDIRK